MASYVTIPDGDIDPESPGDTSLFSRLRDNPIAISEGSTGAPRIAVDSLSNGVKDLITIASSLNVFEVSPFNSSGGTLFYAAWGRDAWLPFRYGSTTSASSNAISQFIEFMTFDASQTLNIKLRYDYTFDPPDDDAEIRIITSLGNVLYTSSLLSAGENLLLITGIAADPDPALGGATKLNLEARIGSGSGSDIIYINDFIVSLLA